MKKEILSVIALVLVIFGLIYFLSKIGFKEIFLIVNRANPLYLGLAFICLFFVFAIWHVILIFCLREIGEKKYAFFSTFPIYLSGSFFNTITPGAKVGGEPVKIYYLQKRYKENTPVYLAGLFFQKIFDYAGHMVFLIFSLISLVLFFSFASVRDLVFILVLAGVVIASVFFLVVHFKKEIKKLFLKFSYFYGFFNFSTRENFKNYLVSRYDEFLDLLNKLSKNKYLLEGLFSLSIIGKVLYFLSFYFVFLALGIDFPLIYIIIAVTFMLLVSEISAIPGGFGIAEGSLILGYGLFGLATVPAASVTLLSRAIHYFYTLIIGFISFIYLKIRYSVNKNSNGSEES